ncbi:MAG TPA: FecR domain-containing protein [Melioribacteraceae bacterium]|nr:FecR domain-containing protein [Melioribacteraceae bacterium]
MEKKNLTLLIEKYRNGKCSAEEKMMLEKYLDSFQKSESGWNENNMGNIQEAEERILAGVMNRISSAKRINLYSLANSNTLLKIAASIVLLVGAFSLFLYLNGGFSSSSSNITWNEKITNTGEKSILTFLDGTKITLNAGSKVRYPSNSDREIREIYLEGEAYFDVAKDPSRPFIVYSQNIATTVFGTSFNVQAFPDENEIMISLVEGNVKVSRTNNNITEDLVYLKPEQQLTYSRKDDISRIEIFDLQESVGWKDNIIKFNDEPLLKAFTKLERFYGVKFELDNQSKANLKITANFKDDSFKTVAEVIKKLTGLKYKTVTEKNNVIKRIVFY